LSNREVCGEKKKEIGANMAHITLSAGWCSNHLAAALFEQLDDEDGDEHSFDEKGRPRLALIDRKGAAQLHRFVSDEPMVVNDEVEEEEGEKLAQGVYGWDGEVEIHHQASTTPYGWSRHWRQRWNQGSRGFLTTLADIHRAEPPELTCYQEGYERMGESRYLDQMEENCRQMAEDMDRLDGFNTFADCFDGFSGCSTRIHEFINDEYRRPSLLFNMSANWEKRTPYSILAHALSLLTPATLNVPLTTAANDVDAQNEQLLDPVGQLVRSFNQRPLAYLSSFLLPRSVNILSLSHSLPSGDSLYHYLDQSRPYRDETCLSWARAQNSSANNPFATFSSYCVMRGASGFLQKIKPNKDNVKNLYIKREADIPEALSLWHFDHCRAVTDSVVAEKKTDQSNQLVALRHSNQMHEWLKEQMPLLGRFTAKLTRMEDDDWEERLEALRTLLDATRTRPNCESSTDESSDSE